MARPRTARAWRTSRSRAFRVLLVSGTMKSMTSPTASAPWNRVSSMLVSGRYICFGCVVTWLDSEKYPPFLASSSAPNSEGASNREGQYQSTVPSVPTRATVLRSPTMPCSSIGR